MSAVLEAASTPVVTATPVGSAPPVIDIAALLAPIPGDNPAGENLQYSGVYDEIREARRADDNLTKGEWEHEPKLAEWPKVVELSTSSLASKTKDVQIGSWLVEAGVQLLCFAGPGSGPKLMRGLHEQFWERLYPERAEGDLDGRANTVAAM